MIYLIIFIIALSYREVQNLIERGSWREYQYWIIIWGRDWYDKWYKNFDSFHVMNGIMILVLSAFIEQYYKVIDLNFLGDFKGIALIIIYWFAIMYLRNVLLHVIFSRFGYKKYWYIIPLIGSWIQKKIHP